MQQVRTIQDIYILISIEGGTPGLEEYIRQWWTRKTTLKILIGCPEVMTPGVEPYYPHLVQGFVSGMYESSQYELLLMEKYNYTPLIGLQFPPSSLDNINVSTILLNDTISAELHPAEVGDYDSDTIADLMVKFNRTVVSEFILSKGIMYGNVTLTLTGQLYDGTSFEGSDTVMIRMPGDVNCDGKVDIKDVASVAIRFGKSNPDPYYDMTEDGIIDIRDIAITAINFGKVYT